MLTYTMRSAAEFEQAADDGFVPMVATTDGDFRAQVDMFPLGPELALIDGRNSAFRAVRTERMVARHGRDDLLMFSLYLAGSGRLRHAGREASLRPGVGALFESRNAWDLTMDDPVRSLLLRFPRSALGLRDKDLTAGLAYGLDPALPAMQLLSGYLRQMVKVSDGLTPTQRQDAGLVAVDMVAMALRGGPATVPGESAAGEVALDMMRRHVRERLGDPDLTAASLARRHHISVRYAQQLFGRIGQTPGAYIREQRMDTARAKLSDPGNARRGIAEIAAEVGIVELRTFERAFVRRYGLTPAQWRRESAPRP
ncbi:AraC family transcriptional regulator [Actinoplanes sp. TBRC 11911]|uniref:AraC family transcriptional regulator n=1 Tax=Actinoplanes sp. TBRC 11911 TaxID=2729386 RepID=UPI00145F5589|nr:AraC family transcriptional regulator [Actinoplanes sp. TBRC 11911]NMO51916.1 AraC family transcriptional regulator [Actinoplanes sp. TBRC 11911]